MKVIIAGSRNLKDYSLIEQTVKESGFNITTVISGNAYGADKLGEQWATNHGIPIESYPANWKDLTHPQCVKKYGADGRPYNALAGHIRNEEMARVADAAIVVYDGTSSGSAHMVRTAKKVGIPTHVKVVDIENFNAKYREKQARKQQIESVKWAQNILLDKEAVVIDTESCGGSKVDEVIGIGIVRLHDGEVLMNTLVQPSEDVKFNWYATQVHGITQKALKTAPRFPVVWEMLHTLLDGKNVLAFNHSSDKRMLEQTTSKYRLDFPSVSWYCVMKAYKQFTMRSQNTGLSQACLELNVKAGNHDAVEDALAAARVVHRIAQNYQIKHEAEISTPINQKNTHRKA